MRSTVSLVPAAARTAMAALALVRAVTLPVTRGELVAAARAKLAKADGGLAGGAGGS